MIRFFPVALFASAAMLSGCVSFPLPTGGGRPSGADRRCGTAASASAAGRRVDYSLVHVGDVVRRPGLADLGAITWVSGDTFWGASDTGGIVCEMTIPVDPVTGMIGDCRYGRRMKLDGRVDVEGLAFDPLTRMLWAADECGASVTGHRLSDGRRLYDLSVPACYRRCNANLSLESLTVREDGLEMWTGNEAPLKGDGGASTRKSKSLVRLSRFVRDDCVSPWRTAGQWAYPVGRLHGGAFRDVRLRGLADLCVLPDGTLLSLEREFSWSLLPCFRCRVYQVDFTGATDVSERESLTERGVVPVSRRRLWSEDMTLCNYEGMCLGRRLADGSRVLLLVSDGDDHAREVVGSFRLSGH